jgi:hypothetical protein
LLFLTLLKDNERASTNQRAVRIEASPQPLLRRGPVGRCELVFKMSSLKQNLSPAVSVCGGCGQRLLTTQRSHGHMADGGRGPCAVRVKSPCSSLVLPSAIALAMPHIPSTRAAPPTFWNVLRFCSTEFILSGTACSSPSATSLTTGPRLHWFMQLTSTTSTLESAVNVSNSLFGKTPGAQRCSQEPPVHTAIETDGLVDSPSDACTADALRPPPVL